MFLDGLDERRLFSTDIASRALEDVQFKGTSSTQDVRSNDTPLACLPDRLFDGAHLVVIFMADVNISSTRTNQESSQNHALDHQMRGTEQDLSVFESRRFALVSVADDVSGGGLLALFTDFLPLGERGSARAAHSPQVRDFERPDEFVADGVSLPFRGGLTERIGKLTRRGVGLEA
jgi:hypothetical protein